MKRIQVLLLITFLAGLNVQAHIINIPTDYTTIQQGIDAATNGDTVLVQPGIYYENLLINTKNIVLGSLFLTTQDTFYISQTIIDGALLSNVIRVKGCDSTLLVKGFTIQNGRAKLGAGIQIMSSDGILKDLIVKNNTSFDPQNQLLGKAPGIYSQFCNDLKIKDVLFENNLTSNHACALSCDFVTGELSNLIFRNNQTAGLGIDYVIFLADSQLEINNIEIYDHNDFDRIIYIYGTQAPYFINNLFIHDNSVNFALINPEITVVYFSNLSIVNNSANNWLYYEGSFVEFYNSILWNTSNNPVLPDQLYVKIENSCYNNAVDTLGNISSNPLFIDVSNYDYRLSSSSSCIGAGSSSYGGFYDISNNIRPQPAGSNPDIGAFENPLGQPVTIDNSLVAHYPFNGNANDESGNGHDGTVYGASLSADRFGNANSAYSFNGTNNYIETANSTALNFPSGYSLSTWINFTETHSGNIISKHTEGQGNGYTLHTPLPQQTIQFWNSGGIAETTNLFNDGLWHHIACTFDGDSIFLYVDNVLRSSNSSSYTSNDYSIRFGTVSSNSNYFEGFIDDILIYEGSISVTKIDSLYHLGGWDNDLVAHYPFNGNANDESGNGNDGTVNGASLTTDRFGTTNSAYYFDGQADIEIPNSSTFSFGTTIDFTTSLWFKRKTTDVNWKVLLAYACPDYGGEGGFQFGTSADLDLYFGSTWDERWTGGNILDTNWHMLTVAIDREEDSAFIYQDGQYIGAGWMYDDHSYTPTCNPNILIGGERNFWTSMYFKGEIDDLSFYNRVLTEIEIDSLYHLGGWDSDIVTHYNPVWTGNPYRPMSIAITDVVSDSLSLAAGDEIAVFDLDENGDEICVGVSIVSSTISPQAPLMIIVSNDDPLTDTIDGFTSGNEIIYRIWSSASQTEHTIFVATYNPSYDSVYKPLGTALVELNFNNYIDQSINLSQGWNIMSFNVTPNNLDMLDVLQPIISTNELVKLIDEKGEFVQNLPGLGWVNTVGDMANTEGYIVKVIDDTDFVTTGLEITQPITIPLSPGWNIMGYTYGGPINGTTVVQPLITSGELVKVIDEAGGTIEEFPAAGWINTIGDFDTGEGYYIKVSDSTSLLMDTTATLWQCGDALEDTRDGQTYNTISIGDQCWMAENLNVGTRIDGANNQTDNSTIEKYCYNDEMANCDIYGGIYFWDEMMQYTTTEGVQGICADDWHIPSDEEWKILEGFTDTQYGIGDPEWDLVGYRGFDAGKRLKNTNGWNSGGNGTNAVGFSALPGGGRNTLGSFHDLGMGCFLWSCTISGSSGAWSHQIGTGSDEVARDDQEDGLGRSVRCIKD